MNYRLFLPLNLGQFVKFLPKFVSKEILISRYFSDTFYKNPEILVTNNTTITKIVLTYHISNINQTSMPTLLEKAHPDKFSHN